MGGTVYAAPGDAGNAVEVHTPAVDRLAAVSRKLRADVQTIRSNPFDSDYKEAVNFFASVRGLAGIIGLLAEQPGYRPTDAEGKAAKARLAPLKAKMDEITQKIQSKVNLMDPLPVTAPHRVEDRANEAGRLAGILHDADSVKDIKEVRDDASIPATWKAGFLEELGKSIHEAVVEVLKTKHEDEMFDAVTKALDSHSQETMVGACLWASQMAASSAGNLPGPNSLYVGLIRIRALIGLKELATRAPQAVLGDILPHWFEALSFKTEEQTSFEGALTKLNERTKMALAEKEPIARADYAKQANKVYEDELASMMKDNGKPQAGPALTGAMTILNIICFLAVCASTDFNSFSPRNGVDLTLAGVNVGAGICTTLVRMGIAKDMLLNLVEHPYVGRLLGWFAAAVSFFEGLATLVEGWTMAKRDWWMVSSGGFQMGSGILIFIGVLSASPGWQLAGVVVGLIASAIAIIGDAVEDKMVRFVSQLIKQIKEAKSTYDNAPLMISVGVQTLMAELEALVTSCNVSELAFNRNWTGPGGAIVSKDVVHDRLNVLGINSAAQRQDLLHEVWAE